MTNASYVAMAAPAARGRQKTTKSLRTNGEPGGNRTHNPQIKSLLLCQLSYRPTLKERATVDRNRALGQTPILA